MFAFLLPLLGRFWYVIVFVVLLGIIGIQHLEIQHYRKLAAVAELKLTTYKANAEANYAAWASSNAALSLQVKERSATILQLLNEKSKRVTKTIKEIRDDPIAKAIVIPLNIVKLYNDAACDPAAEGPSCAEQANVPSASLADLAAICAENATHQIEMFHQVLEWQKFWDDYKKGVTSVNTE